MNRAVPDEEHRWAEDVAKVVVDGLECWTC